MIKQGRIAAFINVIIKGVTGIGVEILATFVLMGIVFVIGFFILKWFSR